MLGKLLLAAAMTKTGRGFLIYVYTEILRPVAQDVIAETRTQLRNRKEYTR